MGIKDLNLTSEQKSIYWKNYTKAVKYFESIYPWFKDREPYEYAMHHKDETLRHKDIDRYIQWNIEDLTIEKFGEHSTQHNLSREYKKGYQLTEESKKNISESKKGNKNPMYGKTPWNKGLQGLIPWNKGLTYSNETKAKISQSKIGRHWYNNGSKEIFCLECPEGFTSGRLKK